MKRKYIPYREIDFEFVIEDRGVYPNTPCEWLHFQNPDDEPCYTNVWIR